LLPRAANQAKGGGAMVSFNQSRAVWELCRNGYPMLADDAERRWSEGGAYHPDPQLRVSRALRALIDQCNYEACLARKGKTLH
jgi:hypothetical protein